MATVPDPTAAAGASPFRSVATRMALAVAAIMAAVCVLLVVQLTRNERSRVVAAKTVAATMIADLFAGAIAPAVDFQDAQATAEGLRALESNPDVLYAAVWLSGTRAPLGEFGKRPALPSSEAPTDIGYQVHGEWIDVTRLVRNRSGSPVGATLVRVSLSPELLALRVAERRILFMTVAGTVLVTAALIAAMRRLLTTRLERLARAARAVGAGERTRVEDSGSDEIATLGSAFNVMAAAVEDREARLADANRRLQGVLDHTGQGIVAFGVGGKLTGVWSRLAEALFGRRLARGASVLDLVFPEESSTRIERTAFREWLDVALRDDEAPWEELVELAPRETVVPTDDGTRTLELTFRPLSERGAAPGALLLATDMTDRQRLEREVKEQEKEHARQMAAMRRIATGGGQVFVEFVGVARKRLAQCGALLEEVSPGAAASLPEVFAKLHSLRSEARTFELREFEELVAAMERALSSAIETASADEMTILGLRKSLVEASDALDRSLQLFVAASPIGTAVLEQVTVNRSDLDALSRLSEGREDDLARIARRLTARPFGESTLALSESFGGWLEQAHKVAELDVRGREVRVARGLSSVLGAVLTHLVRNAVAHGLEAPADRERAGKPIAGSVRVACEDSPAGAIVTVEDDGAGFHLAAIRAKAERLGLSGTAPIDELAFSPGLSTAENVSALSGYGFGLAAVRSELEAVGYRASVTSTPGFGSKITLDPVGAESWS